MNKVYKEAIKLAHLVERAYLELGVRIELTPNLYFVHLNRYLFHVKILPGTRIKMLLNFEKDVQIALGFRQFLLFQKESSIYLTLSRSDLYENRLLTILSSSHFSNSQMKIPLALGYDFTGSAYITDLSELVHLLVVGSSGTGKSTALQSIITSIIVGCSVDSVRLILFDIGGNSLSVFENVLHLYHPIVKETQTGVCVLESLVSEIEKRIMYGEEGCKDLPYIVVLIDEFDDTIASIQDKKTEKRFVNAINTIIRRGRKAKVILILASHDPTLKNTKVNINGIIPRIVFQCSKYQDSLSALGVTGAENLQGKGTMLFKSGTGPLLTLQGSFVCKDEIERILKNAPALPDDYSMLNIQKSSFSTDTEDDDAAKNSTCIKKNKELAGIIMWVLRHQTMSASRIKEKFNIGNRINDIMEQLVQMKLISEKNAKKPRKVFIQSAEDLSDDVSNFLKSYGYSPDDIDAAINSKSVASSMLPTASASESTTASAL